MGAAVADACTSCVMQAQLQASGDGSQQAPHELGDAWPDGDKHSVCTEHGDRSTKQAVTVTQRQRVWR